MKKFFKHRNFKIAALFSMMVFTGVLFTNTTWYDSECSGGQAGQICASGGSITSTQSLINMFKAWGIDYRSLLSYSQSWGQSYSSGTTDGWGDQIVVSATPIPKDCDDAADALVNNTVPPATPFALIAETHFTIDGDDYVKLANKIGADCAVIEATSKETLPDYYQNIANSLSAAGIRVYYMDQAEGYFAREGYYWDSEGTGADALYVMNTRDALMANFLNSISSLCKKTAAINGAEHLDHSLDPTNWYGQRTNLTDLMGSRATVINTTGHMAGCTDDDGGGFNNDGSSYNNGGSVYIESGSAYSY